ncbi:unnamed protein product, partial [Rotaria magnacalcarata]
NDENIPFPNIQELKINLDSIQILPRLFTFLPNPQRLHACVEKSSHEEDLSKLFANLSPLIYLTDFQLRFVDFAEMFDTIASILNQMPFLETFTFDLWTNDERLVNGSNLISMLPSSLKQFHFLIRYYFSEAHSQIDHLLKSWPNHMRNNQELFSLHIVGSMSAETTENLQEWLVHHSDLTREHSFAVAYQKNWFSLWW